MNNKFGNIKKVVHLSAEKKEALWSSIDEKITFFEKNVRIEKDVRLKDGEGKKASHTLYSNNKNMLVTLITGFSLLFGGGVSFAAESSLPGEILYPVKIHVNESLQSAFTFGSEAEAELQLARIQERIEERNELQAENKLTLELDAEIESQVQYHQTRFEEEKKTMEKDEKIDSANTLEIRLGTLLSTFSNRNKVEVGASTESSSQTETSENTQDTNVENSSKTDTKANIDADMNLNIDTGTSVQGVLDIGAQTQGVVQSEGNTLLNDTTEIQTEVQADVDTGIDTLINKNNVDVQSNIQESSSIDLFNKDSSSTIDSTTSIKEKSVIEIR